MILLLLRLKRFLYRLRDFENIKLGGFSVSFYYLIHNHTFLSKVIYRKLLNPTVIPLHISKY